MTPMLWKYEISPGIHPISKQNVLDGAGGSFVRLHEPNFLDFT